MQAIKAREMEAKERVKAALTPRKASVGGASAFTRGASPGEGGRARTPGRTPRTPRANRLGSLTGMSMEPGGSVKLMAVEGGPTFRWLGSPPRSAVGTPRGASVLAVAAANQATDAAASLVASSAAKAAATPVRATPLVSGAIRFPDFAEFGAEPAMFATPRPSPRSLPPPRARPSDLGALLLSPRTPRGAEEDAGHSDFSPVRRLVSDPLPHIPTFFSKRVSVHADTLRRSVPFDPEDATDVRSPNWQFRQPVSPTRPCGMCAVCRSGAPAACVHRSELKATAAQHFKAEPSLPVVGLGRPDTLVCSDLKALDLTTMKWLKVRPTLASLLLGAA